MERLLDKRGKVSVLVRKYETKAQTYENSNDKSENDGYPEKVLCTQYPSTRCSTHFFFPARLENPYEGIIVVQW